MGPESIPPKTFDKGGISDEAFNQFFVTRAMPAVLRGLVDEWPAFGKWTPQWFAENHADVALSVDFGGKGNRHVMSIKDYVAGFERFRASADLHDTSAAVAPYARTWNFEDNCAELCGDIAPLPHFEDFFANLPEDRRPPFKWIFIGPQGAYTPLHVDVWHTDAWLCNLSGRKKFLLFHPGQRRHIEDEEGFIDVRNPDLARFPEYMSTTPVEVDLGPGETIYIPRKWPHCVLSLTDTVSLTVNFLPRCHRKEVLEKVIKYGQRRATAEAILGRTLRASDNILKFCVHGGELDLKLAASILGVRVEELEKRKRQLLEARRAAATGGDDWGEGGEGSPGRSAQEAEKERPDAGEASGGVGRPGAGGSSGDSAGANDGGGCQGGAAVAPHETGGVSAGDGGGVAGSGGGDDGGGGSSSER